MYRALILVAALGLASAFSVEEEFTNQRAKAWLAAHQMPQVDEMDILRAADPRAFQVVSALMNKQQLGLLDPSKPMGDKPFAKLSADQAAQFHHSKADDDRHNVMSLEAKMMQERNRWAASQNSESTVLSKKLDGEVAKPAPRRPSFRAPRPEPRRRPVITEEEIEGTGSSHFQKRSHLGDHVSWGSLKIETNYVKKGKVYTAPSKSWGDIIKNMNTQQKKTEVDPQPKQNALASFSWNDDSDDKPQLSMVSKTQVRVPALEDRPMPNELQHFLGRDKHDDFDDLKVPMPSVDGATKKTDDNGYMSDLN